MATEQATFMRDLAATVPDPQVREALLASAQIMDRMAELNRQQAAVISLQCVAVNRLTNINRQLETDLTAALAAARSARAQHGLLLRELSDFGEHIANLTGQSYGEAFRRKPKRW